jgi:hypothetical protein
MTDVADLGSEALIPAAAVVRVAGWTRRRLQAMVAAR